MSETPRTWTAVFDEHGYCRNRINSLKGQSQTVTAKAFVDAERERLLDLVERLLRERDENAAVAEGLGEKLNHEHGDYASYCRAMDECVSEDPEAEVLLHEYGRLGKEKS